MSWLRNWFFSWSLSGVLLGVGFVFPTLWVIGLGGGVYFLYLLSQQMGFWQKLCGVWLAWTIKAAFSVGWLWSTYPIGWLPLELSEVQLAVIGFSWLMTAVTLGVGAIFLVVITELLHRQTDLPRWSYFLLVIPLLWVVSESFGSVIFSAFFYGPGGDINASFSFGYVGYLLAQHEGLVQIAKVAGVYGLTIGFVFIAGSLLWYIEHHPQYRYIAVSCVLILFVSGLPHKVETPVVETVDSYSVIAIDTIFDSSLTRDVEGRKKAAAMLEKAMEGAIAENPDYIILPEDSRYFDQSRPVSAAKIFFEKKYTELPVVIVDSGRTVSNGETVLQSYIYNGPENSVERYHKGYLVPQGEFISNIYVGLFKLAGYGESLKYLSQSISYRVGPWTSQAEAATNIPGILFCFESFAPRGIKRLTEERSEMPFVTHIASHAWFHGPYTLWSQMETMLRVQAVWSGQSVVSVGNMMSGKFYTPSGSIQEMEVIDRGEGWEMKRVTIPR